MGLTLSSPSLVSLKQYQYDLTSAWTIHKTTGSSILTLFDRMVFHVVGDRDVPIGTGYFVLLQTKVCQLGCALHVSGDQGVPIGPQAGQGRQGSLPYWLGANWHNLDISNIQTGGHLAHLGHQQPWGTLCDTLSQHTQFWHPTLVNQRQKQKYIQYKINS